MANMEDNSKIHLLADVALGTYMQEGQQHTQSTSSNNLDMANMEDNSKLHLLADVALGTYMQEGQQQADATTPQNSSRDGEQLAHATSPENSSDDDEQQAGAPAIQGFTAVNSTAPPASTGPGQQVATGSQGPGGRTNGFNIETGEGVLTDVCGIVTPSKGTPVAGGGGGNRRCPRCNGRFTRPRSVKDHFTKCVKKYGNPNGLRWFDHQTLAGSRKYFYNNAPALKEEEEEEEEGEAEEEEGIEEAEEEGEIQGEEGDGWENDWVSDEEAEWEDDEGPEQGEAESSAA